MSAAPTDGCPQCGSEADWGSSSWCPDCGFYPAIGTMVEMPEFEGQEEVYDHWWEAVPIWMWVLAGGIGIIFVTNVLGRLIFGETIRLYWTVGQMALGLIAVLVCHFLAYLYGASKTDRVGPLDAILKPMGTWQPVLLGMPNTQKLVWGCSWGFSAILFGFLIVGGVNLGELAEAHRKANAEKPKKKGPGAMAFMIKSATVMAQAQGAMNNGQDAPENMEDALTAFAGAAGVGEDGGLSMGGTNISDSVGSIGGAADPDAYIAEQKRIASGGSPGGGSHNEHNDSGDDPEETKDDRDEHSSETSEVSVTEEGSSSANSGDSTTGSRSSGIKRNFGSNRATSRTYGYGQEVVRNEKLQCLVFGYTTNAQGEVRSLLLAAPQRGELRFVGKVSVDDVEPAALNEMRSRFSDITQPYATVRSPYGGRWLKSELFCVVEFTGWAINGRLTNPYISQYTFVESEGPNS